MIQIPFSSKSDRNEPLREALTRTAQATGQSAYNVALTMSTFLEEVVYQVAANRVVSIPGFGMLAPVTWTPRKEGLLPYSTPRFYPAKGFRQEVAATCPPDGQHGERIATYRRNHHNSSRNTQASVSRTFTAQEAFRQQIRAQARKAGRV